MKKMVKRLSNIFLNKEFILFVIIGGINTLSGVAFSSLYSMCLDVNLSFVMGYVCGLVISYVLNSKITFKESFKFSKFFKFIISYIPNFVIQNIVVFFFYNLLGIAKLVTYLLAAIIGIPVTFLIMKLFTFKKKIN